MTDSLVKQSSLIFEGRTGRECKKPLSPSPCSNFIGKTWCKVKSSFSSPSKLICKTINLAAPGGPISQDGAEKPSLKEGKPKAVQEFWSFAFILLQCVLNGSPCSGFFPAQCKSFSGWLSELCYPKKVWRRVHVSLSITLCIHEHSQCLPPPRSGSFQEIYSPGIFPVHWLASQHDKDGITSSFLDA